LTTPKKHTGSTVRYDINTNLGHNYGGWGISSFRVWALDVKVSEHDAKIMRYQMRMMLEISNKILEAAAITLKPGQSKLK